MKTVPGARKLFKFTKEIKGSFGRFQADNSYQVYYLSTSIPAENIDDLATASELFATDKIKFDELIQRDIDHSRVRKIANDYLSKGEGRVIFFPPLLACVLLLDRHSNPMPKYSSIIQEEVTTPEEGPHLRTTWDNDGFQLDLPLADSDFSDRTISWNGEDKYIYEYAATLKLNPRRARLVVLDGQHRLEAIRLLKKNKEQKNIISKIEIPVCIVWAAEAKSEQESAESIIKDFRELFVRVNSEAKKVSGHFITLLKDDSYSAITTRALADLWKATDKPNDWSRLHLLEWNTREEERAEIRTRDFSITTVSIISKTLDESLFSAKLASDILLLDKDGPKFLEIDPEFNWHGLNDSTNNGAIDSIVRKRIEMHLVPALDTLLRKPSPYARLEEQLGSAFGKLQQHVDENNSSFIGLKAILNRYIYREDEIFEESARSAYNDFKTWITINQDDKIYFYAIFQRGLIRILIRIATSLSRFNIDVDHTAKALVASLEELVFSHKKRYLTTERKYTRRTLWRNESVNFSAPWAKQAWGNLIGASLIHTKVRDVFIQSLLLNKIIEDEQKSEIEIALQQTAWLFFSEYSTRLHNELFKETKGNIEDFFSEERAAQLKLLRESNSKKFDVAIREKTMERVSDALTELGSQLSTTTESLLHALNNV